MSRFWLIPSFIFVGEGGMVIMISNSSELYHFGIKGMRWGVRRTAATTLEKKKSKHRLSLEQKYRQKGMSDQEAEPLWNAS